MIRTLYRFLLWLHPPAFRDLFAQEMLWIFDEGAASDGVARLLADGVASLMRQWSLRSGAWRVAAAVAGGVLQFIAAAAAVLVLRSRIRRLLPDLHDLSHASAPIAMPDLIRITLWLVGGIALTVILLVLWVRNFTKKRIHGVAGMRSFR
jgi:uncharacterized integral membrane protein